MPSPPDQRRLLTGKRAWVVMAGLAAGSAIAIWMLTAVPPAAVEVVHDPISETELRALRSDPAALAEGRRLFAANCTLCHGVHGEGAQGPNLRDAYWISGGRLTDLVEVITNGHPAKGMGAWRRVFTPAQIHGVAVYIASLQGSEDGTGKAPEGARQESEPAR